MNKAFHIVLFVLLGVLVPAFLAMKFGLANRNLEMDRLYGLALVFVLATAMMFLYTKIHRIFYGRYVNSELLQGVGILSILSLLLPSISIF